MYYNIMITELEIMYIYLPPMLCGNQPVHLVLYHYMITEIMHMYVMCISQKGDAMAGSYCL